MSSKIVRHGLLMRSTFDFSKIETGSWYAKHMYSAMIKMQVKLRNMDCIIEVRDSRIPLTSANPDFYHRLTAIKPLVVVYSKNDLADWRLRDNIIRYCNAQPSINRVVFANMRKYNLSGLFLIIEFLCFSYF